MKPRGLTIGTAMSAPLNVLASNSLRTLRIIWIPLSSSPWMAADSQTCGPRDLPLMTFMGSASVAPVTTFANGNSSWTFRPGLIVTPPTVMGVLGRVSITDVVFDVLDYQICNVDSTGTFDAFETR